MGSPVVYPRVSRISFDTATGWALTLPRQSSSLPTRTQTGARWLAAGVVCCSHWCLSRLPCASTVSRNPSHDQTPAGQCRFLADPFRPRAHLCTHARTTTATRVFPGAVGRLATLPHPTQLAESGTLRNRRRDHGSNSYARSHRWDRRTREYPPTTCSLALLMAAASRSSCSPRHCSLPHHHDPWSFCFFCSHLCV